MSRSGYSDDYEHMNIYRATVERSINGKRGQAFLRELASAMDDMPVKRLISNELVTEQGDVCAIGVVCKKRGLDANIDVEDRDQVARLVGISPSMAAEIEFENDEGYPAYKETPEEKWTRMRKWVDEQIRKKA
jgi:hypothetical protein